MVFTLTSVVRPLTTSRTNMSLTVFVSPATKSLALLSKSTNCPFVEIPVGNESPLPPPFPAMFTLTRVVVLARRSRRNTLNRRGSTELLLFVSVRLFAVLANKT